MNVCTGVKSIRFVCRTCNNIKRAFSYGGIGMIYITIYKPLHDDSLYLLEK
jgi:hypothetical protein